MPAADILKPLRIFIGTWDTTITLLNEDGGDGAISAATDAYEWSPNGQFLYHDVDATIEGERVRSLEILAAGPHTGTYLTHSFDADGTVSDFSAELKDRMWLVTGEKQRFAGRFSVDGTELAGQWEQYTPAQWVPLMKVTLHKRSV